jgi:membrane protein DedA with SNARE-associated domain
MSKLVAYVAQYGVALVFANVLVEQIGIPVPALPTLIVAGALARDGRLSLAALLAAALVASLGADLVWYALGRRYGNRVLKTLCRVSLSPDTCVRQTEGIFERFGMTSLVVSKFITGFSTVAPPLAGAMGAKLPGFLFYDALGTILWAGGGLMLGFIFHRAIDRVLSFLESLGTGALYVLGAALVLFVLFKWLQRRRFYKALRMARITVEDLRGLFEKAPPAPVVVDVRAAGERQRDPRRIPGAITLEMSGTEATLPGISPETEIVLYCT